MTHAREAVPDDGAGLLRLAAIPVPGALTISYPHEPDYFAAERLKGNPIRIVVLADKNDSVAGCGLRAEKRLYFDGKPLRAGYIGSLRSSPEIRHKFALFQGFQLLRKWDSDDPLPLYFTTIVRGNTIAEKILTSKRCGLPEYRDSGIFFRTFAVSARALPAGKSDGADAEEILDFYKKNASARSLFPFFETLPAPAENFSVVRRRGKIVACAAVIDQQSVRQIRICSYSRMLHCLNPLFQILCYPLLPRPGTLLNHRFLAWHLVKDESPDLFRALLGAVRERFGDAVLLFALSGNSPLFPCAGHLRAWHYDSGLYTVSWRTTAPEIHGVPHLELAEV